MGLGRGDASGNGTWICDIVGYKLSIEIQLQRTGIKIKIREDVWGAGDAAWAYREINRHNKRSTWLQSHVIQTVSTCGPPAHDDERFCGTFSHREDFDRRFKKKGICDCLLIILQKSL